MIMICEYKCTCTVAVAYYCQTCKTFAEIIISDTEILSSYCTTSITFNGVPLSYRPDL